MGAEFVLLESPTGIMLYLPPGPVDLPLVHGA